MATASLPIGQRIYRARRTGTTFGRIYVDLKAHQLLQGRQSRSRSQTDRGWQRVHRRSATSIYDLATELRGLILKGCQFMGARADVLPPEYVQILSKLQDRVPPRSYRVVRSVVEEELGTSLERVFASFSRDPVAAASLAQVHEATLHSGERVAVKIQYPDIAALVHSDIANLRVLFRTLGIFERDFDLMPLVEELSAHVPMELDFQCEAENSRRFATFFEEDPAITTPRIVEEFSTRRVLVMEFLEGIKISDTETLRRASVETEAVMKKLIEAYCEQILRRGFFHADPHPGNLLVCPGETPKIAFLDFGLMKELPRDFREEVLRFAAALIQGQPDAMADALIALGFETRDGRPDSLRDIAAIILEVGSQLRHQSFLDPEVARRASEDLPRLIRENPVVRVPTHVVLLGRVIGLLSGLGRTLGAKVDMVQTILPYALPQPPASTPARPPEPETSS